MPSLNSRTTRISATAVSRSCSRSTIRTPAPRPRDPGCIDPRRRPDVEGRSCCYSPPVLSDPCRRDSRDWRKVASSSTSKPDDRRHSSRSCRTRPSRCRRLRRRIPDASSRSWRDTVRRVVWRTNGSEIALAAKLCFFFFFFLIKILLYNIITRPLRNPPFRIVFLRRYGRGRRTRCARAAAGYRWAAEDPQRLDVQGRHPSQQRALNGALVFGALLHDPVVLLS